jgi:hypothetical protein
MQQEPSPPSHHQINLFKYDGKPFTNAITLAVYRPKQEIPEKKLYLHGVAARRIQEKSGADGIAFQHGASIYCSSRMLSNMPDVVHVTDTISNQNFAWFRDANYVASAQDANGREVLRRLVSKAISNQQIKRNWFVEQYKLAYHWSFQYSAPFSSGGLFEVYPGFIFRPYIYPDGSCAVLVDPKFKFVTKETLRDFVESLRRQGRSDEEIGHILQNEYVIDHCPVVECTYRNNPDSDCRLKGSGKRVSLAGLDFTKSPSSAKHGNLIQYHRNAICKNNGLIAERMTDSSPIALVQFPNTVDPYEYPLERLRREIKLHEIDKVGRIKVMEYMRPPMPKRWNMTKSFVQFVDNVPLPHTILRISRDFSSVGERGFPWENYEVLQQVPLAFANGATDIEPMNGLEIHGPFDMESEHVANVEFVIYCFSDFLTDEHIEMFYNDLVNGFQGRPQFRGLQNLFKIRVGKFNKAMIRRDMSLPEFRSKVEDTKGGSRSQIALVILPAISFKKAKEYAPMKKLLVKNRIPSQFVLSQNIGSDTPSPKYAGLLKNLALEIYAKVGGTAWASSKSLGRGKCFIGLDAVTRENTTYFSVQLFNSQGVWLGGWTKSCDKSQYEAHLGEKLAEALQLFVKQSGMAQEVIVHKEGKIALAERNAIKNRIKHKTRVVSVAKTGTMRIYDKSRQDFIANRGIFVEIDKDEAVLATSGPPQPIQGSPRTLTIRADSGVDGTTTMKEICNDIFQLSNTYGGYILAATSKPVTTYYANKATSICAQYKLEVPDQLWKSAWFV